ncbi:3-hydroxyisobutyrate dehydrogenase [Oryzisolibacter propanilivorax]|uniref:3-hydroxyisobutyrate dehydrogenase n=1 Tax=Oryzisolibacter propanilivorax TaxID=1527607 RepID=A0A1G9SRF2_9BURK|nr:NAD(P)-dependent oxidoreductase [Oryzisolibacter propanilivorax]SDM38039.1 3-hydroxyisobutyrate dehydrogenase [Oryzisolibacter propanilivorax]
MSSSPRIGLIGVGLMGHGIALNLARKGQALTVLEHPGNQPLDELCALGVATAPDVPSLARASDLLILCVTGSPQVEAVLLGEGGALAALAPGAVVIDCSTSLPASTQRLAAAVQAAGAQFLDAPMTRTPREAREGRLNLLVGGDAQVLARCRPVLQCFAENITHVGPVGTGHRMKLLHNYVSLGSVALIAEAAACALDGGVAPEVFVDVLANGGGAGAALDRLRPFLLQHDASALRFAMGNALKDLDYYGAMADEGGAAHAIAAAVRQTFADAVEQGGAQTLVPELVALLRSGRIS